MFESFIEYMWYLFTTPYKKIKKSVNNWYILCQVFGRRFDEAKEDILRARDEGMVATCCHDMLQIHGADRRLVRYEGEEMENYRSRIAMYEEICRLGGTNEGVLLAVKTLGYNSPRLTRANDSQGDRWAEFYIVIEMDADEGYPISFKILQKVVRQWKEVGAKDNYLFLFQTTNRACSLGDDCGVVILARGENTIYEQNRVIFPLYAETQFNTGLIIEIRNNLFYLNGNYTLDGFKTLSSYDIKEEV